MNFYEIVCDEIVKALEQDAKLPEQFEIWLSLGEWCRFQDHYSPEQHPPFGSKTLSFGRHSVTVGVRPYPVTPLH